MITDHVFELWRWPDGQEVCMHVADGRMCDRPEQDHASASASSEAEAR